MKAPRRWARARRRPRLPREKRPQGWPTRTSLDSDITAFIVSALREPPRPLRVRLEHCLFAPRRRKERVAAVPDPHFVVPDSPHTVLELANRRLACAQEQIRRAML